MDPHVVPHFRVLDDLRRQVVEEVSPLSDEQINRTVPGLRNTIGVLLRHLAGSERYWIGEVVGGRPAARDRDAEFDQAPVRKDDVLAGIERSASVSREVLEQLTQEDLLAEVEAQRPSGTVRETKAWALVLATQHMAYHLGQIRVLARLIRGY